MKVRVVVWSLLARSNVDNVVINRAGSITFDSAASLLPLLHHIHTQSYIHTISLFCPLQKRRTHILDAQVACHLLRSFKAFHTLHFIPTLSLLYLFCLTPFLPFLTSSVPFYPTPCLHQYSHGSPKYLLKGLFFFLKNLLRFYNDIFFFFFII